MPRKGEFSVGANLLFLRSIKAEPEIRTMNLGELARIAKAMVVKNKGILAADESTSNIKKRFDSIKIESTEENRRSYREMLFTAPGASDCISAAILYDETIRQKTKDAATFPEYMPR